MFIPAQRQEGVAAIHQVAGHQRVLVSDGGQRIGGGTSNEADNKEDLEIQGRVFHSVNVNVLKHELNESQWNRFFF